MFNHFIGQSGSGFDESEIDTLITESIAQNVPGLIDTAFSDAAAAGETGWVIGPTIAMSGVATVDLSGIPGDAKEVIARVHGMSTTATVNLAGQFLDAAGAVDAAANYFGYASTLTSSGTSGLAWNGVGYCTHTVSMPAANFNTGIVRFVKMHPSGAWHITSLFMDGTRQCVSAGVKDSMASMRGYRLGVVGATFDGGNCGIAWRK